MSLGPFVNYISGNLLQIKGSKRHNTLNIFNSKVMCLPQWWRIRFVKIARLSEIFFGIQQTIQPKHSMLLVWMISTTMGWTRKSLIHSRLLIIGEWEGESIMKTASIYWHFVLKPSTNVSLALPVSCRTQTCINSGLTQFVSNALFMIYCLKHQINV